MRLTKDETITVEQALLYVETSKLWEHSDDDDLDHYWRLLVACNWSPLAGKPSADLREAMAEAVLEYERVMDEIETSEGRVPVSYDRLIRKLDS